MTPGLLPPLVKAAAAKYGSYGQPKQPFSAHSAGGYGQHKKPFSAIDLPLLPPPPLVSQVMEFLVTVEFTIPNKIKFGEVLLEMFIVCPFVLAKEENCSLNTRRKY